MRPRWKVGNRIHTDDNGLRYRRVFKIDEEGRVVPIGRRYETLPDSRQQPKSLAYKLREKENNNNNDTRANPYGPRNCS